MSALVVSEARTETRMTLDCQKAFNVVNHIIMLDKLYEAGIHPALWTFVEDIYTGLTSIRG